jgi:hypothetical protein
MAALKDISNGIIRKALGNSCLSKITLAINAAGAATVKSTGAISFTIDGVFYTKAALAAQALTITHDRNGLAVGGQNLSKYVQPINTTVYYLLCLNAGGTVAVVQGDYAGQATQYPDLQRTLFGTGDVPQEPAGYTAIGLIKVATNGVATFDPATTLLDAAGLTVTYFDLEFVPSANP